MLISKSKFIFLQLPIVFQLSAIHTIGLTSLVQGLSWISSYIVLWIPTFFILYFFGKILGFIENNYCGVVIPYLKITDF
ncbi:hypothetical protein VZ94_20370 [Methylocucumis oryzae]|uniref:Uncharacterized protein n=1 Tax=Methylocucumis oryzae TaxID=1632867 RepID=A0A0F3II63_9GAMM|nr:hypothetical protein VZ94_20370 [Methylocucumis oryzae]